METYLQTTYKTCQSFDYFESNDFLKITLRIISIITFPLTIYCTFLIIYVTPESMKNVKSCFLYVHFFTFLFDCVDVLLLEPYLFLPAPVVYFNGIFYGYFGINHHILVWFGQYSIYLVGMSVIFLYQSRHSMIITAKYRITRTSTKIIYHTISYLFGAIVLAVYNLQDYDQDTVKLKFLQIYPCPPIEYFDQNARVITPNLSLIIYFQLIAIIWIVCHGLFWVLRTVHELTKKTSNISKKTREMQLKFIYTVSIQIAIPLLVMVFPVSYFTYMIAASSISQFMDNFIVLSMGLHGLLSNIALILVQKPYRDFTFCFICKNKHEKKVFSKVSRQL
ncbi:unnamed protein product [Caenorhabditis angaria]|uniref:Serpentine Receptor, class H n=1 Tax=Caenorhabditis angaria TaxID=860376 RepID=A0A9P1MXX6_9PELO|nr:unnamed protein product [Caenorhabditis angaria]